MDRLSKFVHKKHIDEHGKKSFGLLHTSIIMAGPYIATLILFIMHFAVGDTYVSMTFEEGAHHEVISNYPGAETFHWIMFMVFVPMIGLSLILTQKWSLVGAFGETILLLIPTFVWLLGGSYEAIWITILIAFIFGVSGIILYGTGIMLLQINSHNEVTMKRLKVSAMIILRIAFMFSSVVSTMIISVVVLNWADFSMNFGHAEIIQHGTGEAATYVREIEGSETPWIVFITIVTIATAVSLVMLGLIIAFQSAYHQQHNSSLSKSLRNSLTKMIKVNSLSKNKHLRDTIIVKPKKSRKK